MGYLIVENFSKGLDTRKFALTAPAGSLVELNNGHLTTGGEIEKRKNFPETYDVAIGETGGGATAGVRTFGMQRNASGGLTVFGSALVFGTSPTLSQPVMAAAMPSGVTYQQLKHPAVSEGTTFDKTKHAMTAAVASELSGGLIEVSATYADGKTFVFYDGALIQDVTSGLILAHLDSIYKIAEHFNSLVNQTDNYTSGNTVFTTASRNRGTTTCLLQLSADHDLIIGEIVLVYGVGGIGFNGIVTITGVTSNSFTYLATSGSTPEVTTSDTGGKVVRAYLDIVGGIGTDYDLTGEENSAAGTLTVTKQNDAVATIPAISAVGQFEVVGGSAGTQATATLTDATNVNPSNNETVTIGTKTYTFKTTLTSTPGVEGEVKIGADANTTLANLVKAINRTGTNGTHYWVAAAHSQVTAGAVDTGTHAFVITAIVGGTSGNSIATTETSGVLAWGAATMAGGADTSTVTDIQVNGVSILNSTVNWTTNNGNTATLLAAAINSFQSTPDYSATASGNTVKIFAVTAGTGSNNYSVKVIATGDVCIGEGSFALTGSTTFSVTNVYADGVQICGTHALGTGTIASLVQALVTDINAGTATHGYLAFAFGTSCLVSKAVTASDAAPVDISVTVTGNGSVVAGVFPSPDNNIAVALSKTTLTGDNITFTGFGSSRRSQSSETSNTDFVTCTATGGSGSYTFAWIQQDGDPIFPTAPTSAITQFYGTAPAERTTKEAHYICKVTDTEGKVGYSTTLTVILTRGRG